MKKKYNIPATEVCPMEIISSICANSIREDDFGDGGGGDGNDIG